ncbi:MAG: ABC transporter permease, partial [Saprospiraceae bacterium]
MDAFDDPTYQPPRLARRFLLWFLKDELAEEVEGDLEEKYAILLENHPRRKANWKYCYQVLQYLRPFAIRKNLLTDLNPFFMYKIHFKVAWRSLLKQKMYSLINLTGMTVGMTCFILLALYIQYESSYDLQHEKVDQIYRVAQTQKGNTFRGTNQFAIAPVPLGIALKEKFPEVEATTTVTQIPLIFWRGEETFYQFGLYADTSFLDVFSHQIIEGDAKAALQDRDAIILTKSLAEKYFGAASPLGQLMELRNDRKMVVKAVIEDVSENQHLGFEFIIPIENYGEYVRDRDNWQWASNNYVTYVVLPPNYNFHTLEDKMKVFEPEVKAAYAEFPFYAEYFLQPLRDVYLHSNINMESGKSGDVRYLYLSATIALIILLLALFNYMNLSVARFGQRAREVGVRKVLGAKRGQLVQQFMAESILLTALSFTFAIGLSRMLLPVFNNLMGLQMPFNLGNNRMILFTFIAVAVVLGALSGLYPAILSSAIAPVKALQSNWFKNRKSGAFFRNTLVVGQFATAIILAIGSVVIYQQLEYIQNKKLGYSRDQVMYVRYRNQHIINKTATLRNELLKNPQIEKVSLVSNLPLDSYNQGIVSEWEGNTEKKEIPIYRLRTDYDFIDLFEIDLIEGRNFSRDHPTDSTASYILNEYAVKALGWETAAGKSFKDGKVIGVVKDFHFQPFKLSIEPMFITFHNKWTSYYAGNIAMKVDMKNTDETIAHVQQTIKAVLPEIPFDINYMDDAYNQL